MKRTLALLLGILLVGLAGARGQGLDDEYVKIFNLIQEADGQTSSRPEVALSKYTQAQAGLQKLQRENPDWNPKVINFRLQDVAAKISGLGIQPANALPSTASALPSTQLKSAKPPNAAAPPSSSPQLENQLALLRSQVEQLQAEKSLLQNKLRESMALQPANADPHELARAEDKIRTLLRENELLKVTLDKYKAPPATPGEIKSLDQAQRALAEANRKLASETQRANALAQDKQALQARLDSTLPGAWNNTNFAQTRKALDETSRQLTEQKDIANRLAAEKAALQSRIAALSTEANATSALRTENQQLKKQLADARSATAPGTARGLEDASHLRAQLAALQSDMEIMRLEKIALENRVKQGPSRAVASNVIPPPGPSDGAVRIRQLETERDDLQRKLEIANKELYGRNSKAVAAKVEQLEMQLAAARARLEVFEARQIPYTSEELALFKKAEVMLANTDTTAGKKSVHELSPASVKLVADAHRYFSAHQLDKAEESYSQVVRQDQKSVAAYANLAVIQIERNHLDTAETNLKQALAIDPQDAYALSVMGNLKFRQGKYDDAFEVLSRAAKIDPKNAEIQNYLGLALSEKGQRNTAESAFRKAVELEPNYAAAHNNLAVFYLTHTPPYVELARWHYQRALAAGHPPNAELEKMFSAKSRPAGAAPVIISPVE